MRFNSKKDINPKYLLLILTFLCVILIVVSYFAGDRLAGIKRYTGKLITPIQNGVNQIGIWTDSKLKNAADIKALQEKNDELEEEISSYKEDIVQYQNELAELDDLRNLYNLDDEYPDYNKTAAHVFATNSSSWFSDFYIDKGTEDGIFEGANVMCGEGLCGIVTETFETYSKVRGIIDDKSEISGKILPANTLCTIEGSLSEYKDGYITAKNIDKDAAISVGDKVVTSQISNRYHPGILIGYISEINMDTNNLTMTVKITPATDFSNIGSVLVITDKVETPEGLDD